MTASTIDITNVSCIPFTDQKPGTAGLRKKVSVFAQPHYLETFVQSIFDTLSLRDGATLVVGGDGRYHNSTAIQIIFRLAAANGISAVITGRDGLLSTPAASHLIRQRSADAGFILTASHNPGGPDGDFGIKFNMSNGGQAPEQLTDAVFRASQRQAGYRLATLPPIDLARTGTVDLGHFHIEIVEPADAYVKLMQSLFDFDLVRDWLRQGARLRFDAMHGVTGPYARAVFVDCLGASADSVLRGEPLGDFGGLHPDPNPIDAAALFAEAMAPGSPDLLAASDGDGDRNMILGSGFFLSPCDSVAVLLAHIRELPGYRQGVPGAARSMPTSRALDAVAHAQDVPCFETPTGWRFFCNLLDAGLIGLCGEESFGTGSSHVREKDGLWAVLAWANLLARLRKPLAQVVADHWARFGRHHYQRWDYHVADVARASDLVEALRKLLPTLRGTNPAGGVIDIADDFTYTDPVDKSRSERQGIRLSFSDGARIVYRLSGTGTSGATLRVYLERHVTAPGDIRRDSSELLAPLGALAAQLARVEHFTGLKAPAGRI